MKFKNKDKDNDDSLPDDVMDEFAIQAQQRLYEKVNLKNIRPEDKAANLILTIKDHVLSLEFDYKILLVWNVAVSLVLAYLLLR